MSVELQSIASQRTWDHDVQMTCCQFAPDGKSIIMGGHDGLLYQQALEGEDRQLIQSHHGWIEGLCWTPDRSLLISVDSWGRVCAWHWTIGKLDPQPAWTIENACSSWLRNVAISPDGQMLATCGNEPVVRVYATVDRKLVHELRGHQVPVFSLAFSPDGSSLASGDLHGHVHDWNLANGECRRRLSAERLFKTFYHYRQGGVRVLAFDATGKHLYCGGFEGTNANQSQGNPMVLKYDWASGEQSQLLSPNPASNGPITDLALHPDGFLVAAGSSEGGGTLWFWLPDQEQNAHHLKHGTSFRRFSISPDGQQLLAATFGSLEGQRGGNGRQLDKEGNYADFGSTLVLYKWK